MIDPASLPDSGGPTPGNQPSDFQTPLRTPAQRTDTGATPGLHQIALPADMRSHGPDLEHILYSDVSFLALEVGERHVFRYDAYLRAADWISSKLDNTGVLVPPQEFETARKVCRNILGEIPGATRANEIVVVGAHYDSIPNCPAANDNGSGIAALLFLADRLAKSQPQRTIRFAAFANEEPPFFHTEKMGSVVYADSLKDAGAKVVGMVSLETMGYFSDVEGSQRYPAGVGWMFPEKRGNFIGMVGNLHSYSLVHNFKQEFSKGTDLPATSASLPNFIRGVGDSDHWSFWQAGYPAIMITDTAHMRYPFYHTRQDTPDKIDYARFAKVVTGVEYALRSLANPDPIGSI